MREENGGSGTGENSRFEDAPAGGAASFRDRSGRIKGMGIFEIVLGSLCGLMLLVLVPATLLQSAIPSSMGGGRPAPVASLVFSGVTYAALAASLIWVGVGALKLRRWVPKVVLAINWPFLVIGAVATVSSVWLVPMVMHGSMSEGIAGAVAMVTTVITVVALFVMYVVIPGLHVLLFRGRDVQATCDARDPTPRWTDDLHASVVGLVVWLGASSLGFLGMGLMGYMPVFGLVLTGVPALAVGALLAAGSAALARWAARPSPAAWWAITAFVMAMFGATLSTVYVMEFDEIYRRSGLMSEQQIEAMAPMMGSITSYTRVCGALCAAAILGTLIAMKRHFRSRAA
jgi:hypothetical protein